MGDKEWAPSNVFDIFGDALARRILLLTNDRPLSADGLSEHLDASPPTIYRRVNALIEYDLLKEHQRIDTDGHHYKTFETTLKRISFEIEDGGYEVDVQMRQNLVDQFEAFWSELESHPEGDRVTEDSSGTDRTAGDTYHG